MMTSRSAVRSTSLILSATLLAIAVEPLPTPTSLPGVSGQGASTAASVSYGDLDGDGFVDMAIGNTIYWGSAIGWNSTDKIQLTTSDIGASSSQFSLWIVPNVSGAGTDGKVRADLVSLDSYGTTSAGAGKLWQALATTTHSTMSLSASPILSMPNMMGRPAVGTFAGGALNDVAWIDASYYATLVIATNAGGGTVTPGTPIPLNDSYGGHSAVSAVNWMGKSGTPDLIVVSTDASSRPEALLFAQGSLASPALTIPINPSGTAISYPEITVGDINGDDYCDVAVAPGNTTATSGVAPSYVIYSSKSTLTAPSAPSMVGNSGMVWIVPDVTGDGIDDVAVMGYASYLENSFGGLIHGGSQIDSILNLPSVSNATSPHPMDRPITRVTDLLYSLPYVFSFQYSPSTPHLRPIATAYAVNATPWDRHLVLVDYSGNGSTTTSSVLPIMAPTITGAPQAVTAAGAQPIVDPAATIQFPTANGQITALSVTISGAQATDTFTDANALPVGVLAIDGLFSAGAFTRVYTGAMTVAEATAVLTGIRFTPTPGGSQRSAIIVLLGKADPTDATEAYASASFQAATIDSPVPSLAFTTITGANVGGTVIAQVSGGTAPYTIIVDGGTGLVGGTSSSQVRGATVLPTNLFITPNKPGTVTVTVTDSTSLRGSFTFVATDLPKATEPAPVVAASVGAQTVFGAICPGTVGGVDSLRKAFGSADNRTARGFTWDSASQTYRELPSEPTGGLLPTDGVFLATRVNLGLDFSGPAMPPGSAIVLRAGWNFVGLGPVQLTSGTVVRTHSLADDFNLTDLSSTTVATANISSAYLWDGATYASTAVLQSGIGYWIKNVSSPAGTLLLTRKDSDFDGRALHTTEFARNVDAPPAPPTAQTSAADSADGGGCGAGSGIAIALGGLLAFLRLGFRRSSK